MNPAQLKKITTKASRVTRKLCRRFDVRQSVVTPYALTWFEVIGYTVLLEPDIALGKHHIGRSEQVLHLIVFEKNGIGIMKKLLRQPFCTISNSHKRLTIKE